jgi:hypothetical protein
VIGLKIKEKRIHAQNMGAPALPKHENETIGEKGNKW